MSQIHAFETPCYPRMGRNCHPQSNMDSIRAPIILMNVAAVATIALLGALVVRTTSTPDVMRGGGRLPVKVCVRQKSQPLLASRELAQRKKGVLRGTVSKKDLLRRVQRN